MNKAILIILDGWGIGKGDLSDAIAQADTPFMDDLLKNHPNATLRTDGLHVGLPEGQMGNSEVGHLNIGAGRVVFQELVRITNAIEDGTLANDPTLNRAFDRAANGKRLHFMGLLSDGGVHSTQEHLHALLRMAGSKKVEDIVVHAFLDGRDTDPNGGKEYVRNLLPVLENNQARLGSIIGRYYAMDRDKRWERIKLAYDLLVKGEGTKADDPLEAIQASYDAGVTDEFIKPISFSDDASIREGDVVICFNFRTDRCREITQVLTQVHMPEHGMSSMDLHYVTMTEYDPTYKDVEVLFSKEDIQMTLGEVVQRAGGKQIRIAETEKYPHVTFFFSGGREKPFEGEERMIVPSPKVATYDHQPEMSAPQITDSICLELEKANAHFICLNFANPDMVGHTGVFEAIVKAVETTDTCAKQVSDAALINDYRVLIIADHGNADMAKNPDGSPHTAHTTNPVPVVVLGSGITGLSDGKLADVAPTILDLMGIEKPTEMTGSSLLVKS